MTLNFVIRDVGHKLKNGQAALQRGTHFEGKHSYDSTDLSVVLTTVDDVVIQPMSIGSHTKKLHCWTNAMMNRFFNE